MIRPLDNERCNRGITFERNKIMKKQINNLMIALAFISTLGCLVGCVKQERDKSKQTQTVTSSSTKEDKEAIKQKQLAYLKEHEQEIVDFVKSQNPKIESVQIDWDETQWGVAGNGTPQGGDEMILIFGDGEWIFQLMMINQLTCEKCLCFMNLRLTESLFPK